MTMQRAIRTLAALVLLVGISSSCIARAVAPPALIISEVKVRNDTAGFDEFIEFYNPGTDPVSLNDYFVGYINTPAPAADQQFTKAVIGDGLLEAGQSFVLAKNDADLNLPKAKKSPFSSLSDTGGTLRILDASESIIDQLAWSSTQSLAIAPIQYLPNTTAAKAQSFNRGKDTDGKYLLTSPTWQLVTPNPVSNDLLPIPEPEPDPVPEPTPELVPDSPPDPTPATDVTTETTSPTENSTPTIPLTPPQITELLPNPAAPASDSTDEYIELYNSNDTELNLNGYKLQSGNTYSYSHTFSSGDTIAPHTYHAFYITETNNILSNTSGQARLLDSTGVVASQTNPYDSADDGDAWAFINGAWQWTTTPTPNAANELTLPVLKIATTKKATTPKAATSTKKTTAKVAAAKTTKPKATAAERAVYQDPDSADIAPIHPSILAGVGVITLVYAVYEYRHDAFNRLHQFRRYRGVRREARQTAPGQ